MSWANCYIVSSLEANSKYVARVIISQQLLFASEINDLKSDHFMWYNMDDGNSPDCRAVMDNKTFFRKLKDGEIEFVKK